MAEKRDPRVNPMAGDELEVFHGGKVRWWRGVCSAQAGVRYITSAGKYRWLPLNRWREQMRNAKILRSKESSE